MSQAEYTGAGPTPAPLPAATVKETYEWACEKLEREATMDRIVPEPWRIAFEEFRRDCR